MTEAGNNRARTGASSDRSAWAALRSRSVVERGRSIGGPGDDYDTEGIARLRR
jgi:hypothetical protein